MSTPPQVPGYRIEGPIGFGSGGALWLGRDGQGRPRAIRVLDPLPAGRRDARLQRLDALKHVRHQNLAQVLDVVTFEDAGHAVVSAAVPGPTLSTVRAGRTGLTAAETAGVVRDLASGLSVLHADGLIHGDVAPGNVVMSPEPDGGSTAVLVDLAGEVAFECGTEGFTAPELGAGEAPGTAADVFALASLAVWMVRNEDRVSIEGRLRAALSDEPAHRPDIVEIAAIFSSDWTRPVALPGAGSLAGASLREHAQRDLTRRKATSRPRHRRRRRVVTGPRLIAAGFVGLLLMVGLALDPFGPGGASRPDHDAQPGKATHTTEEQATGSVDPAEVISAVRELTAVRDAALNAADADALASVSQPQSPAHERDIALLSTLQQAQVQVQDLRTEVTAVDVTDLDTGTARATVRLHQQPYQQILPDGEEVTVPERRTCAVLTLADSPEGWRVSSSEAC